jgi:hypothetical protein
MKLAINCGIIQIKFENKFTLELFKLKGSFFTLQGICAVFWILCSPASKCFPPQSINICLFEQICISVSLQPIYKDFA